MSKRGVALMGICNVTPDSFADGGAHFTPNDARARVDALLEEGADIVDIGGESTRPKAKPVSTEEQLARVLDVVGYAVHACSRLDRPACVSIDTQDADVARACLAAGAAIVNDVSCGADVELARACAEAQAAYVLMHSRGSQEKMAGFSIAAEDAYRDVVFDVSREWKEAAERVKKAGVDPTALVMDPGLGFAKNARHSAELVERLGELVGNLGVPVMVGASRKSFLKAADPDAVSPNDRLGASLAVAILSVARGAQLLRVHDVAITRQTIDTMRLWGGDTMHAAASGQVVTAPPPPSSKRGGGGALV
ncbi:MAG TPA: dihydropteroate synthase [Polyangiaceae bacterium]